jgi:tetratricopeptide (TPR) repeat protein
MFASSAVALALLALAVPADWTKARLAQDRAALDRIAAQAAKDAAGKQNDATAQYNAALAAHYRAEILIELHDRNNGHAAAEAGIQFAERAVALQANNAEYHRVLGALCGQTVRDVMSGLRFGKCALAEVNKAIELNPKSAEAWLSRGVGYSYLPAQFGGGPEQSLKDIDKALGLNPNYDEGWLWRGVILRRVKRDAEARAALQKAVKLNPKRVWAKQQLEKTPAK